MESKSQKMSLKIDPRTLIVVNILFCILLLMVSNRYASHICFVIAMLLMLLVRLETKLILYSSVYLAIILTEYIVQLYEIQVLIVLISIAGYLFCKIIPMLMITAIMINRVKINELITALEKLKLQRGIILGIVVSFRFVPTMKYEFEIIKESIRLRGIEISYLKMILTPIKTIERFLIPLLFRCLKVAEELTATALTRGVEHEVARTAYFKVKLGYYDWTIMLAVTLIACIAFYTVS